MADKIVVVTVPIIKHITDVNIHLRVNKDTCKLEYVTYDVDSLPTNLVLHGVDIDVAAVTDVTSIEKCADKEGACKKTLTLNIKVKISLVYFFVKIKVRTYNFTVIFNTDCYPQCCGS